MPTDINALREWNKFDKASKDLLLKNVFCHKCFVTTIVDYDITFADGGILLDGKCKKCGQPVARLIEDA